MAVKWLLLQLQLHNTEIAKRQRLITSFTVAKWSRKPMHWPLVTLLVKDKKTVEITLTSHEY